MKCKRHFIVILSFFVFGREVPETQLLAFLWCVRMLDNTGQLFRIANIHFPSFVVHVVNLWVM